MNRTAWQSLMVSWGMMWLLCTPVAPPHGINKTMQHFLLLDSGDEE